jgi:hypothetical protein
MLFVPPSLGRGSATNQPASDPLPTGLPLSSNIAYWFAADHKAYSDVGKTTLAKNGDPVAAWGNNSGHGTYTEDAVQNTLANRPIYRTGGSGGKPYLEVSKDAPHFFQDLSQYTWPSGVTSMGGWLQWAYVVEFDGPVGGNWPIFGSTNASNGGKAGFFFTSGNQRVRGIKNANLGGGVYPGVANAGVFVCDATSGARAWMNCNGYAYARFGDLSNATSDAIAATQFLRSSGNSLNFHGRVYEVMVWNTNTLMNATQREQVNSYFRSKYSLATETAPAPTV